MRRVSKDRLMSAQKIVLALLVSTLMGFASAHATTPPRISDTLKPRAAPVSDPLTAMQGRWRDGRSSDCETDWFEYSLSEDRRQQIYRDRRGETSTATILHVELNRFYLFYDGESRRTANGDLFLWWFVFEGPNRYRMRRIDWPADALTEDFWVKCP